MRSLFFMLSMLVSLSCFSQGKILTDSTFTGADMLLRNETVTLGYDTAYILNKTYFNLVSKRIGTAISTNDFNKQIIDAYKTTNTELKRQLEQKEDYYQRLKSNFDHLDSASTVVSSRTIGRLDDVKASLDAALVDLNSVKASLALSMEGVKKQRWREMKIAIGGFGVGVGVTALIFILAK